ncbi:hypothetical protein L2E82_43344 [Cichorium intybus]|uniref:Uncharacterized protein n=1 Tax=Cichorium intybus TaxID=13427 RepID=A0ACB8ZNE4_CICIN|nr:hypothetical protein L2E82_43344 [Cichorium intybus]
MTTNFPVIGLDHEQVPSENELPLETAWSEEDDCVPLKQRLKMLHATVVARSREDILISARSPVDDSVKKDDDVCDSLGFHSNHDESERRSNSVSSEQSQHGTIHTIKSSPIQDTVLSEKPKMEYNDIETCEEFLEDLDHVVLKERRRMLLSREPEGSTGPSMEHNVSEPSTNSVDMILLNAQINGGSDKCYISSPIRRNDIFEKHDKNVKIEPLDDDLQSPNKDVPVTSSLHNQISIKSEPVNNDENFEDIIDHMMLGDRMRLLASKNFPKTHTYETSENSRVFSSFDNDDNKPTSSESSKPFLMKRPRKRRKTVTDSIETALEEDAPGLLQVLIEKGVLVDEIKLYGENEDDEALDIEETFSELEDVIEKIFSQRQSFLKFGPIRCGKGEKASYCLACLISLVEQARYLRLRKWPVEWGWCRDLQSFIFVFERHNRIVLERPEYGYATYFFELVDALPVKWQIKRLVTTMKLTSCGRITLIENRPLTVGKDLTEGEARVLMEYGWIPDSGLGTMLNYRDRVVHDRKNESESSEWRSKIGKLLTDAYNGGIIVPNDIPKKVMEFDFGHSPEIKLEMEE